MYDRFIIAARVTIHPGKFYHGDDCMEGGGGILQK